jgi:hypothetical protein
MMSRDQDEGGFDEVTRSGKASFGVTFVFAPRELSGDLEHRLEAFCLLKKYQARSDRWVGLSCVVDDRPWLYSWLTLNQPWEHDEGLERLVEENLPSIEQSPEEEQRNVPGGKAV